ncbi:NAD(P)H-dependent flavin oxidoreductase [Arthrobacter sp. MMS18-M83]|uniref:NAD(P)H-dependent flavin oxidoreductase n=1 Tax=Arthrobacter sp. MMS18-M83 TaxID=2996261 RepID=UPI00227AB01D|nr:nitronate monooxygenase [Arthrobacter sp. MMS18-M83]WAH97863.1 nitronate monooxygenase [Arthrobacter sp. MMS18-M83]
MTWKDTRATRLFNIELPIVLGPFGGLSSVELSATVSEAGGLGSYGLYGYEPERIAATARELREASGKPFALNLWLPIEGEEPPSADAEQFAAYVDVLRPYFEQVGVEPPTQPEIYLPDLDGQIQAAIDAQPAVLSFVFGVPSESVIEQAHRNGIVVVGTATTVDEAVALDAGGVDAIVATGMEAGGHRVSFLRTPEDSLVGTLALVPQAVDAVSVPVIAAGGISDGRGVAAALALGADAVQIGSAFLATRQSAISPAHLAALHGPDAAHTVLTRALSGRLARGIPNRITAELADPAVHAPFPIQNWLTGKFRPAAAIQGIPGLMSMWAGQSTPLIREDDARKLVDNIVDSVDAIFGRLGS